MTISRISYKDALAGVVDEEARDGLVGLVEQHKNWGANVASRIPSAIIVLLVDEIKRLKECNADRSLTTDSE